MKVASSRRAKGSSGKWLYNVEQHEKKIYHLMRLWGPTMTPNIKVKALKHQMILLG
jgi:hypothetical protein